MAFVIAEWLVAFEMIGDPDEAALFAVGTDLRCVVACRPCRAAEEWATVRFFSNKDPLIADCADNNWDICSQKAFVEDLNDER